MADLNKIIDELSSLTVVEAAELKQLEEKWGVTAAPVAAAPAGGAAAPTDEKVKFHFSCNGIKKLT